MSPVSYWPVRTYNPQYSRYRRTYLPRTYYGYSDIHGTYDHLSYPYTYPRYSLSSVHGLSRYLHDQRLDYMYDKPSSYTYGKRSHYIYDKPSSYRYGKRSDYLYDKPSIYMYGKRSDYLYDKRSDYIYDRELEDEYDYADKYQPDPYWYRNLRSYRYDAMPSYESLLGYYSRYAY